MVKQLPVVRLLSGDDDRCGRRKQKRVWHHVGLVVITIETQGGGQGGRDLRDDTVQVAVQVSVRPTPNVEAAAECFEKLPHMYCCNCCATGAEGSRCKSAITFFCTRG